MSVTFEVTRVSPGKPRFKTSSVPDAIKGLLRVKPEAAGCNAGDTILEHLGMNGLVRAAHDAFNHHLPLVLSPDDIWLAIAQGFAQHVNANTEELRKHFVAHEGKFLIEIERNAFVKGSPDNDWQGAFGEFSDAIAEHIGKKRDLLVSRFTTTGPIEKAASEVVLMDAMSAYFSYGMRTLCGIPKVTLLGETSDWESIRERTAVLSEFGCDVWVKSLVRALDYFVEASRGNVDLKFWQSFYKIGGGSGGPYTHGAINVFFPYLKSYKGTLQLNTHVLTWEKGLDGGGFSFGGPSPGDFPIGVSKVPFIWNYYGTKYPMSFLGGFVGTHQSEDGSLRPAIGWAVADREASDEQG